MIIYEGIYSWDGIKVNEYQPVSWTPGSFLLKIIDLSVNKTNVKLIKPYAVIAINTGDGVTLASCIDNFAKNVCREFGLVIEKVLWLEYSPVKGGKIEVAMFKKLAVIGGEVLYSVNWRPIMKNELEAIKFDLPEAANLIGRCH